MENFDGAKYNIIRQCPFARNANLSDLVSACNGNYTNCKIPNCPRRLV